MGKEYKAKVFKSGNSLALRLPKELGGDGQGTAEIDLGLQAALAALDDLGRALERADLADALLVDLVDAEEDVADVVRAEEALEKQRQVGDDQETDEPERRGEDEEQERPPLRRGRWLSGSRPGC